MPSPNRVFLFSPFLHPTLSFCLSMYMCTCIYCESRLQRSHPLPLRYCDELGLGKQTWRAQTKPCAHQDPGERSSDPTRNRPRHAHECQGVSSGGVGWWWPVAGSKALSAAMPAWDILKEVTVIFITSTIVQAQVKQQ